MWVKFNTKTWRHNNGAVISNESHSMYGSKDKLYYLYKNDFAYNNGCEFLEFASIKAAKEYHETN